MQNSQEAARIEMRFSDFKFAATKHNHELSYVYTHI